MVYLFDLDRTFLLLALITPVALLQDGFRYRALGVGLAPRAALSDAAWFATFTVSIATLWASDNLSVAHILIVYGAGAVFGASYGVFRWPHVPSAREPHAPVRSLFLEGCVIAGLGTLAQPTLALTGGLDALGIFRIAQITGTIPALIMSTTQGAFLRTTNIEIEGDVRRMARRMSNLTALLAVVITSTLAATPDSALAAAGVFDRSQLLTTVAIVQFGMIISSWVMVGMWRVRVTARVRSWLGMRSFASATELVTACAGALLFGSPGVAVGSVVNNIIIATYVNGQLRSRTVR